MRKHASSFISSVYFSLHYIKKNIKKNKKTPLLVEETQLLDYTIFYVPGGN